MWAIVCGIILFVPWIILQLCKVSIKPEKRLETVTATLAGIGVIMITLRV